MAKNKRFNRIKTKKIQDFFNLVNVKTPSFADDIVEEDNKFYLLSDEVKKIKEDISRSVFSAGTFLGEKKKGEFYPSFPLVELLAKESERKIYVDKKTEWLFVCGRDIFSKSITKKSIEKGIAFVYNNKEELLGLVDLRGKEATNLFDKGDFLRREMK